MQTPYATTAAPLTAAPLTSLRRATRRTGLAALTMLATSLPATADDTSVFAANLAEQRRPNILFVLDYSGSMQDNINNNWVPQGNPTAKIEILKRSVNNLLTNYADSVNAGLGPLYDTSSGGVRWPITDPAGDASNIDPAIAPGSYTSGEIISRQLERVSAAGATATVNALLEAALYFRGEEVTHDNKDANQSEYHKPDSWDPTSGTYGGGNSRAALPTTYLPADAYQVGGGDDDTYGFCTDYSASGGYNDCAGRTTYDCTTRTTDFDASERDRTAIDCSYKHPDRWNGANYVSPIADSCAVNAIVLISDGQPTTQDWSPALERVLGASRDTCEDLSSSVFNYGAGEYTSGNCGPEIAAQLADNDQIDTVPGSRVKTYTIGFSVEGSGQEYLKRIAAAGDGEFHVANTADALDGVLQDVFDDLVGGSQSFTELSVDINRATFSNDNRAYVSLFEPTATRSWPGNVKGYFIGDTGLVDTLGNPALITTDNGNQFHPDSRSFWSNDVDGNEVELGGASEELPTAPRSLYTWTGNPALPANGNLTADAHRLSADNTEISAADLGLPAGSAARDSILDWLRTAPMGDPLHTRPLLIDYDGRRVVYTMTNQGLLHAFDATTPTGYATADHSGGEEIFAFMPPELLVNLPALKANANGGTHIYGLDGGMTPWHDDINGDGIVNGSDTLMLVVGMRRGGNRYYALDVTDPDSPRYRWTLGAGDTGFEAMAQTWSRMSLVSVKRGSNVERVLMFGGGYDAAALDGQAPGSAASGNALYIIDRDGALIWSVSGASEPQMTSAIPSDLTVIDSDKDGLADRLYVGDLGGQVWRLDFNDVDRDADFHLSRLADLDGSLGEQPFFYAPSVSIDRQGSSDFLSIAIGSGNRTDPLDNNSTNSLFMLRDEDVEPGPPATTTATIGVDDLYNATANDLESSDASVAAAARTALDSKRGWRIALNIGEKSLSPLVSFEGMLLATTYEADTDSGNNLCGFDSTNRLYMMDIATATPMTHLLDGADPDATGSEERIVELGGRSIPSAPVVVFPEGSSRVQIMVDREVISLLSQKLTRVFWHAR